MAWDVKEFMADYLKDECTNIRCRNRLEQSMETARELREAQAVLRKVMQRAKRDLAHSSAARDIYQAIADYNTAEPGGPDA